LQKIEEQKSIIERQRDERDIIKDERETLVNTVKDFNYSLSPPKKKE